MQLLLDEEQIAKLGLKGRHELYHIRTCIFNGVKILAVDGYQAEEKPSGERLYRRDGSTEKALLYYGGVKRDLNAGYKYVAEVLGKDYDMTHKGKP